MPRQGVPYPSREICSLKCQIDNLQRQINELMKSINGVQGDGQGNVSLVSGDPAVVINNDASQNQIEIALDQSELPAAAVRMVNGMTGAVVLAANDIYAGANTVGFEIADLKAENLLRKQGITNEISNRQAADAALQGNINTLQASIPGEAAQAVANDPTVQQLAVDVPNKLDKITSGSALKAYTHTGATQGEKSVVDGTTADSIAIRDANGRLQAADPANGATDKTLVTANWVSQTGDSGPNNLIHKAGNETKTGVLSLNYGGRFSQGLHINNTVDLYNSPPSTDCQYAIQFRDKNDNIVAILAINHLTNDTRELVIYLYKADGTRVKQVLATT